MKLLMAEAETEVTRDQASSLVGSPLIFSLDTYEQRKPEQNSLDEVTESLKDGRDEYSVDVRWVDAWSSEQWSIEHYSTGHAPTVEYVLSSFLGSCLDRLALFHPKPLHLSLDEAKAPIWQDVLADDRTQDSKCNSMDSIFSRISNRICV